jgi:hypothetical protein
MKIEVGVSETKAEESRAAQGASRSRGRSECKIHGIVSGDSTGS